MMDWQRIAEIALTCIASVGGIGVIIIGVVKYCGDTIADRLSKKYQLQMDKEIERYKTELSKKEYVSKTRFETEFSIYRELTMNFSKMVIAISILVPYGLVNVPVDKEDRKKLEQEHFVAAQKATVEAQDSLHANKTFIPKELCKEYEEILKLAGLQLDAYMRRFNFSYSLEERQGYNADDYERTKTIQDKWNEQTDRIRDYLANLEVIS